MQMFYHMLSKCQLQQTLNLNKLDCLSSVVAAMCHDLGHDGYTNSYHVNAMTQRAIDSNDISVQESYHVVALFRIIRNKQFNFV